MLGFGALGESALGEIPAPVLALTHDILQEIVTNFVNEKNFLILPPSCITSPH
jgi:hypothetical protein